MKNLINTLKSTLMDLEEIEDVYDNKENWLGKKINNTKKQFEKTIKEVIRKNNIAKKLKEIKNIEELPEKLQEELRQQQIEDILERYDNEDYYNPDLTFDFLRENGYKLKD